MTWNIAELEAIRWAEKQGIISGSTSMAQLKKALEETYELSAAIDTRDTARIVSGLGDVLVCLINVAAIEDLDLTQCLKAAVNRLEAEND